MLTQFNFKNFKSYKELTTLEMQAEKDDEFENTLLKVENIDESFLPISAIYGPNGGGKTTVLEALVSLVTHVISPINLLRDNKQTTLVEAVPFKFGENTSDVVEFEIYFIVKEHEYKYILNLENEIIIYESLQRTLLGAKKPEKIFIREKNNIDLGNVLTKNKVNVSVNEKIPYISFLAISYNIDVINDAVTFFRNVRFQNTDSTTIDKLPLKLLENQEYKSVFLEILKSMDSCIEDFIIEKDENNSSFKIYTIHKVKNKKYQLSLGDESRGTIKIFSLLPGIIDALLKGGLCIFDELDSRLHPKLLQFVIELFKEPGINLKKAQLIFTSHDLATMNHKVFRRDEILFAAKNNKEESELYSLSEIRDENGKSVNKNSSYSKQYLEGKYGSDPYLKRMKNFSKEE